jgi:uncharacterized protein
MLANPAAGPGAFLWIEKGYGVAPTAFGELVSRLIIVQPLRSEIDELIELKRTGAELDYGPRMPAISQFIEAELSRLESLKPEFPTNPTPTGKLDEIFRNALKEAWE